MFPFSTASLVSARRLVAGVKTSLAGLLTASSGAAAVIVWNDSGTDFATPAHWVGSNAPANDLVSDVAEFATVATHPPTLASNRSIGGLVFSGSTAVTFSGAGTLTLGAIGLVNSSASGTKTISAGLALGAAQTFANTGTLTLSGALAAGAHAFTLDGTGAAGAITGILSGSGGLTKNGSGTWTLSGANTFTGPTTVNAGTLRATTSATALGTGAATLTLNGGTLTLANNTGLNFARNTTIAGDVTLSADRVSGGAGVTHTLGTLSVGAHTVNVTRGALATSGTGGITFGATTLTGDVTFAPAANALLTLGAITQSGGTRHLTKTGPGTLTLAGTTGTYDGSTTILGGVLNAAVLANGGVTSSLGNSSNAAANLVLDGGTLTYNGTAVRTTDRLFTVGTAGGSLGASGSGANTLTFTNTGDIALSGTDTARTFTLTGTNTAANTFAPRLTDNGTGATSLVKSAAGSWVLTAAHTYTGTTTISGGTLALAGSGAISSNNLVLSGGVLATNDTLGFTRTLGTGPGQVRWSGGGGGFAAYGGPLTVGFSTTAWGGTHFIPTGQALVFGSALGDNIVTWNTDLNFGATTRTITVNDNSASASDYATISGALSGTGGLTKNGAGLLLLTGANTYSGTTTVAAGTLALGGTTPLSAGNLALNGGGLLATNDTTLGGALTRSFGPGAGQLALSSTGGAGFVAYGGALTFAPGAATWGTTTGFFSASTGPLIFNSTMADNVVTWTSDMALGATARVLTVNDNPATTADYAVISGVISGSAATLTKNGAGRLDLTGLNTYTGKTVLGGGMLTVNTLADLSTASSLGAPTTIAAGTIDLGATTTGATLRYIGSGGTTNRGLNLASTTGGITLDASGSGAIVFSSALTATGAGSKTLTLTGTSTAPNEIGAIVNNSATNRTSVLKTGAGTWQLSGANTYTGTTTVTQGTLRLGPAGALPNTAVTVTASTEGGTATLDLNGTSATIASLTLGGATGATATSAAHVDTGAGTLTLGGNITFSATGNPLGSTLTGNLALGTANRTVTVNDSATASEDLSVSAAISGGFGLIKAGPGTLVLSGANTYTGATSLTAGRLRATSSTQALGAGTLSLTGGSLSLAHDTGLNFGRNTTLGASLTIDSDRLTTGTGVTHTLGTLSQGAFTLTLAAGSNVTSGTAGLAFGATTLTGNAGWNLAANTELSLGALSTGGAARTLTKTGAGTLALSAAAGTITTASSLTINNGTVRLDATNALGASALVNLTLNTTAAATTALLDLNGFNQSLLSLTFGGTGATSSSTNSVNTGSGTLTLGGNVTFTNTNNPLGSVVSGNLALGAATRTFTVNDSTNAATDLALAATISGTGGLTKAGTGTLALSGANTYSGLTTLSAGNTIVTNASALGTGDLTLGGGTLTLLSEDDLALDRNTTLSANTTLALDRATTGAATTNSLGTLTQGAFTLTLAAGSNVTSGTAGLAFGATTLTGNAGWNLAANTELSLGALSTGGAARTLTKTGAGTLALSAAAGTITTASSLTINNGTVRFDATNALGTSALVNVTINSTAASSLATLDLNGFSQAILGLTFGGTGATATSTNDLTTGTGTLFLGGTLTFNATNNPLGSTLDGKLDLGSLVRVFNIGDSSTADIDFAAPVTISSSAGGGITKSGAGTLYLSGNNTYSGTTTLSAGNTIVASSTAFGTGPLVLGGGTLTFENDTSLALAQNATLTTNTTVVLNRATAGSAVSHALGNLTFNTNTRTLATSRGSNATSGTATLTVGNVALNATAPTFTTGADTALVLGALSDNGTARALTKTGPGTLVLSAPAGTLTSGTSLTINGGTVQLDASLALGATALTSATLNTTTASTTARLDLNGFNQSLLGLTFGGTGATSTSTNELTLGGGTLTLGGNVAYTATNHPLGATLAGPGSVNLGGASRTVTVGDSTNAAVDLTVSADITGTGGLAKTGAGTLLLAGTNTYSGATTVNHGTLQLGSSSALPATALTLNANAAGVTALVDLNGYNATVTALTFGGTGGTATSTNLLQTGTGTLTLGGNVTFTPTGNPLGATLAGQLNLGSGARTFNVGDSTNAAIDLTVSAALTASTGSLVKSGTGTLLLTAANQHSGGTSVTAGVLALGHAQAAGTGTLTLGGGTLRGDGSALTLGNTLSLTAATTLGGAADLTFTQKLTSTNNHTLTVSNTGLTTLGAIDLSNSATNRTLTLALTGGEVSITGVIANGGTATASALVKTGPATLTLSAANTYSGTTTVQNGTLVFDSLAHVSGGASALGAPTSTANGTVSLGSTTNSATLRYVGSGHASNRVLNLAGTTGGATLDASGSGALVLTSALTATGAGAKTLTLTGTSTAANTLGGAIVNNSALNPTALLKTGSGTWELGGVNTFTGGVTVEAGTLTVKTGASLHASNALTLTGGTVNFNHTAQTLVSLDGSGGTLHLGSGHTLSLNQPGTTTFNGVLGGNGHLVLSGGGTLTLAGAAANTRTGSTTLTTGTLALAKSPGTSALAGGTITLGSSSAFLRLDASHQIANTTDLVLTGGTLQLQGFSETLATLQLGGDATIDFGSATGALVFANSSALTWSGTLSITNYTVASNSLRFGTSAAGLTSGQLAQINFIGHGLGRIDASGFVTPIPEPSTYALLGGLGALMAGIWRGLRRRAS